MSRRKAFLVILLGLCLIILSLILLNETHLQRATRFAKTNDGADLLNELVFEHLSYYRNEKDDIPDSLKSLFSKEKDLSSIHFKNDDTISFWFTWSSHEPEKWQEIVYRKNDEFDKTALVPDNDDWKIKESEDEMSSFGGGANGKGYVKIKRIYPCWFFVEEYNPT